MTRGYWDSDPLAEARARAAAAGECPVNHVDEFTSEHSDCWAICSMFDCEVCVATPEDFGWHDPDEDDGPRKAAPEEDEEWRIPF